MDLVTRRAGPDDLDACASVLGAAFSEYPWTRWTVDPIDHHSRVTALQRMSLEHFGLTSGEVWVTTVDGGVRSVAAWVDSRLAPLALHDEVAIAVAELEGSRHAASLAAEHQVAPWRPTSRHLFLGVVGTDPSMHGRGLGTRTLGPLLAAARREKIEIVLETSTESNVAWYSSLGFRVIDHLQIDGGGPDVWAMSLDASATVSNATPSLRRTAHLRNRRSGRCTRSSECHLRAA